jgi:hypothetical protein
MPVIFMLSNPLEDESLAASQSVDGASTVSSLASAALVWQGSGDRRETISNAGEANP